MKNYIRFLPPTSDLFQRWCSDARDEMERKPYSTPSVSLQSTLSKVGLSSLLAIGATRPWRYPRVSSPVTEVGHSLHDPRRRARQGLLSLSPHRREGCGADQWRDQETTHRGQGYASSTIWNQRRITIASAFKSLP